MNVLQYVITERSSWPSQHPFVSDLPRKGRDAGNCLSQLSPRCFRHFWSTNSLPFYFNLAESGGATLSAKFFCDLIGSRGLMPKGDHGRAPPP
jgi:hypothetical protein